MIRILALFLLCTGPSTWGLSVSRLGSWTYRPFPENSLQRNVFQAEGAITLTNWKSEEIPAPTVFVRKTSLAGQPLGSDLKAWRTTLLGDVTNKFSVQNEKAFVRNGRWHYYIELQADTGTENMLNSTQLATVANGQLIILVFDARRPIYLKQNSLVRDLFKSISILPDDSK